MTRTDELFDIIRDYPDSMGALDDLKVCIACRDKICKLIDRNAWTRLIKVVY